jgi:hypothetical protein
MTALEPISDKSLANALPNRPGVVSIAFSNFE